MIETAVSVEDAWDLPEGAEVAPPGRESIGA